MTFETQWLIGVSVLPFIMARYVPRVVSCALIVCSLSAIFVLFGQTQIYGEHVFRFEAIAGRAYVSLISVSLLAYLLRWRGIYFLPFFAFTIDNTTLRGAFFAMLMPIAIKKAPFLLLALIPLVVHSHGSTAIFLTGLSFAVYFFSIRSVLVSAVLALGAGLFFEGFDRLFDPTGRIDYWIEAFWWWTKYANQWIGTGLGSFAWFGPLIYHSHGRYELWTYMHNEWLQILFEQGIVGLAAIVYFFGSMLYWTRKNRWLFTSLIVYAAAGMTQMPLRNFVTALWGALLVQEAIQNETDS